MVFKALSNLRVFTELDRLASTRCRCFAVLIQRSLRFYTEFFDAGNKFENYF